MEAGQPSRTALIVAGHRAAHQITDKGFVFKDRFARLILDAETLAQADERARDASGRPFRWLIAARSRFAEDCLAEEVGHGVRQVVVLGAGLDTFGLRNPYEKAGLRVFEIDHPATQVWKQSRLAEAGIAVPPGLVFVPADFEHQNFTAQLRDAGFDAGEPAFYIWLGVVPYLRRETVFSVLHSVGQGTRTSIVFDYSEPLENYPPERRARAEAIAARAAAAGEPWLTLLDPDDLAGQLRDAGFSAVTDLGPSAISKRYFGVPADAPDTGAGPRVVFASKAGRAGS